MSLILSTCLHCLKTDAVCDPVQKLCASCVSSQKCINHPTSCGEGCCINSGFMFKKARTPPVRFRISSPEEPCLVCVTSEHPLMLFPASKGGCAHWLCVDCCRKIIYCDSSRGALDPVLYGCPLCPNGCSNPRRGVQCACGEHDLVIEDWRSNRPTEYNAWFDDEVKMKVMIETV